MGSPDLSRLAADRAVKPGFIAVEYPAKIKGPIHVPKSVARSRELSPEARFVWIILKSYQGPKGIYVGIRRLRRETGYGSTPIARALRELESGGWITRVCKTGAVTHYTLWYKPQGGTASVASEVSLQRLQGVTTAVTGCHRRGDGGVTAGVTNNSSLNSLIENTELSLFGKPSLSSLGKVNPKGHECKADLEEKRINTGLARLKPISSDGQVLNALAELGDGGRS